MAINLNHSNVATRENRIGSITGYIGTLRNLAKQSECGTLKGCSRCFSQSSTCLSSCALAQLSAIRDVAIIHHGPAGCSVASAGAYYLDKVMAKKRGVTNHTVYVGTDMNEKDTIFGSADALRRIILEVNKRYSPKAIFVASSCATGIIGEDIDSVVDDVRDEIDVPIAAVHCEGFKSRIWATGFDISDHAVLSAIVQPPKQKRNTINFKNFYESARPEIIEIFKNFDLEPIFLYCNSTVEELVIFQNLWRLLVSAVHSETISATDWKKSTAFHISDPSIPLASQVLKPGCVKSVELLTEAKKLKSILLNSVQFTCHRLRKSRKN